MILRKNWILSSGLSIFLILALWFGYKATMTYFDYRKLQVVLPISIEKGEVKNIGDNQYRLVVKYSFQFDKKIFTGEKGLGPIYPNPWAAEFESKELLQKKWNLWIDPKNPEMHQSWEKSFPLKAILTSVILIGLFIYFLILGIYVKRKNCL